MKNIKVISSVLQASCIILQEEVNDLIVFTQQTTKYFNSLINLDRVSSSKLEIIREKAEDLIKNCNNSLIIANNFDKDIITITSDQSARFSDVDALINTTKNLIKEVQALNKQGQALVKEIKLI